MSCKHIVWFPLWILFAAGTLPAQPTLEEALEKHYVAIGGLERWREVRSLRCEGELILRGDTIRGPMSSWQHRPDRVRLGFELMGTKGVQASAGGNAWWHSPLSGAPEPAPAPEMVAASLHRMADLDGPLVDWRDSGHRLSSAPGKVIDDRPTLGLRLQRTNGEEELQYLDLATFLVTAIEGLEADGKVVRSVRFHDYRQVDGLQIPFRTETDGPSGLQTVAFSTCVIDEVMADSFFEMPAPRTSAAVPELPGEVTTVATLDAGTGGLELDADGRLYSADFGARLGDAASAGSKIWRIDQAGVATVFAAGFEGASGNALDAAGNFYQSNIRGAGISRIDPRGQVQHAFAEGIPGPVGIAIDEDGGLFVTSCGGAIYRVDQQGETALFVESPLLKCPNGIALGGGELYVANFYNGDVLRVSRDGDVAVLATLPGGNNGHLVFHDGRIYVAARGAHQIYSVSTDGTTALVAGSGTRGHDDGPAGEATFSFPNDLAITPDGKTLFVNEVGSLSGSGMDIAPTRIRRITLGESRSALRTAASESEWSRFLELRVYSLHEPQRDRFLEYFEEHFLESQEVLGMRIWGQFRDLRHPGQVIWLRGFRSLEERVSGLETFYTSPVWQECRVDLVPMFAAPATHVHFLEPVVDGAFAPDFRRAILQSELPPATDLGVVVAEVYSIDDSSRSSTREWLEEQRADALAEAGGRWLGLFAASRHDNDFPALPVIENEDVLVLFFSFASEADYERTPESDGGSAPNETFVLEPGLRSRLFHRQPVRSNGV
ncbi:MAG: NIPSNAP family protein [Thermoanaerobaculia bacterium]|nr:NIPSNAP family protein [Thermoanaerobaculia bacterium]